MNERNLSRRLSSNVVEALKAHGHILVVKGGATALARELDDLMAPEVATIEPRLRPYTPMVGEPTSTFGDETVDQAVEDMVLNLTHALMNSDHVEDVFAEDAVIRRDIFRVVRDGLREPHAVFAGDGGDDGDHTSITVKLDTLGYVAATASRRTDADTLRQALDRAASVAGAQFSGFSPELREATFRLEGGGLDERLEIEEAVADELTDLVEQGFVELPTVERRIDLGRAFPASELRALRARIDAAGEATLLRSGCAAAWEIEGSRTLRILFTPLSEQDAAGLDVPTSAFARELAVVLGTSVGGRAAGAEAPAAPVARVEGSSGVAATRKPGRAVEAAPSSKRAAPSSKRAQAAVLPDDDDEVPTPPVKRKTKAAAEPAPSAKETAKPAEATVKRATVKRAAVKATTVKATTVKATTVKAAAKPAAARKRAGESATVEAPGAKGAASARKTTTGTRSKTSAPRATGKQAAAVTKATKAPSKKR